jgi:hypothetical protein
VTAFLFDDPGHIGSASAAAAAGAALALDLADRARASLDRRPDGAIGDEAAQADDHRTEIENSIQIPSGQGRDRLNLLRLGSCW